MATLTGAPSVHTPISQCLCGTHKLGFDNDLLSDDFKPLASAFAGSSRLKTWNFTLHKAGLGTTRRQ